MSHLATTAPRWATSRATAPREVRSARAAHRCRAITATSLATSAATARMAPRPATTATRPGTSAATAISTIGTNTALAALILGVPVYSFNSANFLCAGDLAPSAGRGATTRASGAAAESRSALQFQERLDLKTVKGVRKFQSYVFNHIFAK